MKYIKMIIPFLDDILIALGLICFITASYLVNVILGTYVLGIEFFVAAYLQEQLFTIWNYRRALQDFAEGSKCAFYS